MALSLGNGAARILIRPDLGAGLAAFDIRRGDDWLPIFRRVDEATTHPFALSNILLLPFSGRVSGGGFRFGDRFHPMEPNMPGEKYPLHGSAFSAVWTIVETTGESVTLAVSAAGPGPFLYDATMTYRLDGTTLTMTLGATNRAALPLPYGGGFHPWFVRDGNTLLTAPAEKVWFERDDHLPDGLGDVNMHPEMDFSWPRKLPQGWINNWFSGWPGKARLDWPDRGLAADIIGGSGLDQYVLFSPSGDADYLCFEPVSHPVDAFNLAEGPVAHGMVVLPPGATLSLTASVRGILAA
ncbi:aldose 1-epimerase [Metarhizobium album]|uniref:Aldose 1-epimerase n=1 Tax=Metarhizobium album TaxID=2182425 RepID=A0A2U2DR43_9HYPH|nr:aldose 1-epimerase [Rhizobium album]PWE55785.1 aldose 1-epimerase [Rhizobium album]